MVGNGCRNHPDGEMESKDMGFPLIADETREIAELLGMLAPSRKPVSHFCRIELGVRWEWLKIKLARATQVLLFASIYQGAILAHCSEPQPEISQFHWCWFTRPLPRSCAIVPSWFTQKQSIFLAKR